MRKVPREAFVPSGIARGAYDDCALPIEAGQTISQPYIVALMAEAANLKAEDRVLEIGTGSGYAAAVFSLLVARVYTIERHALLAEMAERRLQALGYNNIEVRAGNGMVGWPEAAPFEAILVAASGTQVPETWKRQLTASGRLIMPLGGKILRAGIDQADADRKRQIQGRELGGCDVRAADQRSRLMA